MNLGIKLDEVVEKHSSKTLFSFYENDLSYEEFGKRVNSLANGLKELGFKKGDFIHVLVQNSPKVLASYFAIQKISSHPCVPGPQ